jgi:hypothetical protein
MSTRTLLKDRRHFFKLEFAKDPTNLIAKKVADEITFILEALKGYKHAE